MELRPYQKDTVDAVLTLREEGIKRTLYTQATGTGKTVVAAEIIRRIREKDKRPALVLAHREELLLQAAHTIRTHIGGFPNIQIEKGETKAGNFAEVVVASLPTLARKDSQRLEWLSNIRPSVIWYDEAHHAAAKENQAVLYRFGAFDDPPSTFLVGCTATATRLDNKPLFGDKEGAIFERVAHEYNLADAIREGWLCMPRGYLIQTDINLDKVKTIGGDFSEKDLAQVVDVEDRSLAAAQKWMELGKDRPTIVFCVNVEHVKNAARIWQEETGVSCEILHGGLSPIERREVMERFKSGFSRVLFNCQIATEGFDHPPTSCIVMLRPTKSWSLYVQCLGRGSRLSQETNKSDFLVLDVTDNSSRHSIMSLPKLAGAPAKTDMGGMGFLEVLDELEGLGEKAKNIEESPGKTWREIVATAKAIDLLSVPQLPEEISRVARLRWIEMPWGYSLSLGGDKYGFATNRRAMLMTDSLGQWQLVTTWREGNNWRKLERWMGTETQTAIERAERLLFAEWEDGVKVAQGNQKWHRDGVTNAQMGFLKKLGVSEEQMRTIKSKGDASQIISLLLAQKTGKTGSLSTNPR